MPKILLFLFLLPIFQLNCSNINHRPPAGSPDSGTLPLPADSIPTVALLPKIITGAAQLDRYLPLLKGKRLGLVVNQSSLIEQATGKASTHLVDTLQQLGVQLVKIFALEHGFRGTEDAGAVIKDGIDTKSGLPIVTLYGKKKEPTREDLADIDLIVFDIQDVGTRFYTYISSLHYILQGAAKQERAVMILDRPNPNGHYVDGPLLDPAYRSFVGMHPVPVVHGLTIGEYGQMINGEGWLDGNLRADLTVISCKNYAKSMPYPLPVAPSPNLPNFRSVLLYPSLCFFEGTIVSVGRGTLTQFQVFGHPKLRSGTYQFTPTPGPGSADPELKGQLCLGFDLTQLSEATLHQQGSLQLRYLLNAYEELKGEQFFNRPDFFDKLAGSDQLRKQIVAGWDENRIRESWQTGLTDFKQRRKPYLLYED